jgi:plasmid maintenance system killer protein
MKKSRFTESQILAVLKEGAAGVAVAQLVRKHGISSATQYSSGHAPPPSAAPGWRLHSLTGELRGFHSITVNGNWRVIFRFVGQDVELVDYLDYH